MKCPCGGVILADTEDWDTPLCYECYEKAPSSLWYSPEENNVKEGLREDGYIFKDDVGEFHMWFTSDAQHMIKNIKYYYIGDV